MLSLLISFFCSKGAKEFIEVSWFVPVGAHKEVNINPFVLKSHCVYYCPLAEGDLPSERPLQEALHFASPRPIAFLCHFLCIDVYRVMTDSLL